MDCRERGVAVRSAGNCLIAQCAIESGLTLLHHDRDFQRIASVVPTLNEKSFLRNLVEFRFPTSSRMQS